MSSLVNKFNDLYTHIQEQKQGRLSTKILKPMGGVVKRLANVVMPIYYRMTASDARFSLPKNNSADGELLVVSLTSFPMRINKLWIVVESILHQSRRPDRVVLWLSDEEFDSIEDVPHTLRRLQSRGLDIEICNGNLLSHKKFYYVFSKYPDATIVTVDDDVIYRDDMLEMLCQSSENFPGCVCCNRSSIYGYNSSGLIPYSRWRANVEYVNVPRSDIFPTGIGGVLYPKGSLYKDLLNVELFMSLCPKADDVWLKAMANMNKTKTVQTPASVYALPVLYRDNITLASTNVVSGNDVQLKSVIDYYMKNYGVDPFRV